MRSVRDWQCYFEAMKKKQVHRIEDLKPTHSEIMAEVHERLGILKPKIKKGFEKTDISEEKVTALRDQLKERIRYHIALVLPEEEREEILKPDEMTLLVDIMETLESYREDIEVNYDEPTPPTVGFYYPSSTVLHPEKVMTIAEKLGALFPWDNNRAVIRKEDLFYVVYLDSAYVKVYSFDYESEANICLQLPAQRFHGWSNEAYSDYDLLIIAKIVALFLDQLPSTIPQQIDDFLVSGASGANVFAIAHPSHSEYSSMIEEVTFDNEYEFDQPNLNRPPPERGRPLTLHNQLRDELRAAFQRIQTNLIFEEYIDELETSQDQRATEILPETVIISELDLDDTLNEVEDVFQIGRDTLHHEKERIITIADLRNRMMAELQELRAIFEN
ncbi:MAG: hypothetical protein ACFFDT_26540 [Candidatus Hodarchaeota archaeon]